MKRRDFLQKSLTAGVAITALPAINNLSVQALANAPALDAMNKLSADSDRIFVLVQLAGGNDGLNTLVPITNQTYYDARRFGDNPDDTLAVDAGITLPLNDTLGWHPMFSGMRDLYNDEKLAIVQGVTYPNPNRSHFRGTDIWLTATDAGVFEDTGWVGRYLETIYPDYPETLPPDPIAIQIGSNVSLGFQSDKGAMAVTFRSPEEFNDLVGESGGGGGGEETPDTPAGRELDYIRVIAEASQVYSKRVKDAFDISTDTGVRYPETQLANSLKIVAQMISGGLNTKFYLVNIGGFDTHANQVGFHDSLLEDVSGAIKAFMDDIEASGHSERVAGMTFSEFGRRVQANGSSGTDHGTAAPLFVFGKNVIGGRIHGTDPDLDNLDERGDLLMQYDYRQIYASALLQWFGAEQSDVQQALFRDFDTLPLFQEEVVSVRDDAFAAAAQLRNYPNPVHNMTTIEYNLQTPAFVELAVLDMRGAVIARPFAGSQQAGKHRVPFAPSGLPAGTYFYRLKANRYTDMRKMQVVR